MTKEGLIKKKIFEIISTPHKNNLEMCYYVWKEAQKELLEELKIDYAEGNPAEDICLKYINKWSEITKQ